MRTYISTSWTAPAMTRIKQTYRVTSSPHGIRIQLSIIQVSVPLRVTTNVTAQPMPKAMSIRPETPRYGQMPRNLVKTRLFTITTDMKPINNTCNVSMLHVLIIRVGQGPPYLLISNIKMQKSKITAWVTSYPSYGLRLFTYNVGQSQHQSQCYKCSYRHTHCRPRHEPSARLRRGEYLYLEYRTGGKKLPDAG